MLSSSRCGHGAAKGLEDLSVTHARERCRVQNGARQLPLTPSQGAPLTIAGSRRPCLSDIKIASEKQQPGLPLTHIQGTLRRTGWGVATLPHTQAGCAADSQLVACSLQSHTTRPCCRGLSEFADTRYSDFSLPQISQASCISHAEAQSGPQWRLSPASGAYAAAPSLPACPDLWARA